MNSSKLAFFFLLFCTFEVLSAQIVVFPPRYLNCERVELDFIDPDDICTNCCILVPGADGERKSDWMIARYKINIYSMLADGTKGDLIKEYYQSISHWEISSGYQDLTSDTYYIVEPYYAIPHALNTAGGCVPPQPDTGKQPNHCDCNPQWVLANSGVALATTEFPIYFGEPFHNNWDFTDGENIDHDRDFSWDDINSDGGAIHVVGGAEGEETGYNVMISRFELDGTSQSAWVSSGWRLGQFPHDFNLHTVMQQKGWHFWPDHSYVVTVALRKNNCTGWIAQSATFRVLDN